MLFSRAKRSQLSRRDLPSRRRTRSAGLNLERLEERVVLSSATPAGFTPAMIQQAYGFNQIFFNNGTIPGDGRGQTIAIVDAYDDPAFVNSSDPGFSQSDLARFDRAFGLPDPPSFTKYNESGFTTGLPGTDPVGPGPNNNNMEGEEALDIEWAHAMAPGASIDLVEANSKFAYDFYSAVETAQGLPGVSVVSMSWGGPAGSYDSYLTHNGVAFVASAGDYGTFLYPASSPNVLGVAGTYLTVDASGNYVGESVWSPGGPVPNQPVKTGPDVGYAALGYIGATKVGFATCDSYNQGSTAPWIEAVGTSAGAPQWAAIVAIADQGRALDWATPEPLDSYELTSIIHDMSNIGPNVDFHQLSGQTGLAMAGPHADRVVAGLLQAPISIPTSINVVPGLAYNGTFATFKDCTGPVGQGPYSASINYGDGTSGYGQVVSLGNGQYKVVGTHTYSVAGVYNVTAQISGDWLVQFSVSGVITAAPVLAPGASLTAGQAIHSNNGQFELLMQTDGNLVEYGPVGEVQWNSGTFGHPGAFVTMQGDGNLVVYSNTGQALWNSGTGGHPGASLHVQDDGNLVIYALNGTALWATGAGDAVVLGPGSSLWAGQAVYGKNAQYYLTMQTDGNLVEYGPGGRVMWNSGTYGHPGAHVLMQTDGNLVVYSSSGQALWWSGTQGNPGSSLVFQSNGNLVIYSAAGTILRLY